MTQYQMLTPDAPQPETFTDATAAVDRLNQLYAQAVDFLRAQFKEAMADSPPDTRVRAFYPEVRFTTSSYAQVDTRLSFGHVSGPAPIRPQSRGQICFATI